jgi:hypothetical protein
MANCKPRNFGANFKSVIGDLASEKAGLRLTQPFWVFLPDENDASS